MMEMDATSSSYTVSYLIILKIICISTFPSMSSCIMISFFIRNISFFVCIIICTAYIILLYIWPSLSAVVVSNSEQPGLLDLHLGRFHQQLRLWFLVN